jgi:hypothetical protein
VTAPCPGNGGLDLIHAVGVAVRTAAEPGALSRARIATSSRQLHAESVDISSKLQLKPGQSVAVLNPPPGMVLPDVVAAASGRTTWALQNRRWRPHARIAWHGSAIPRAASSGRISTATGSSPRWPARACSPSARCRLTTPGPRCGSARPGSEARLPCRSWPRHASAGKPAVHESHSESHGYTGSGLGE